MARTFHQFPLVPLESSFEDGLERVRIAFSKYGIKAVIVCDGLSNPLKKEEDDRRGRERDESLAQLRTLYTTTANPTADDLATALKLSKDSCRAASRVIAQLKSWAYLHPSDVRVVGSFSEADQQLGSMCADGTIDAVLGEDGDFLCNGAPVLITSLDYWFWFVVHAFNRNSGIHQRDPGPPWNKNDALKYVSLGGGVPRR